MRFESVDVSAYSGYRANERPLRFRYQGCLIEVTEIIDRWYEGSPGPGKSYLDYFKIRGSDNREYVLRYNGMFDSWALMVPE